MPTTLTVTSIGDENEIILPRELADRLNVNVGDEIILRETRHGVLLTTPELEFARQMAVAEEVMHEDREALRMLAQSAPPIWQDAVVPRQCGAPHQPVRQDVRREATPARDFNPS